MRLRLILIAFIIAMPLQAQDFEAFRQSMESRFDSFRIQKEEEFEKYRAKLNAEFAEFMRQSWSRFEGNPAQPAPPPIPDVPPVVFPELDEIVLPDDEIPFDDILPIIFEEDEPIPLLPLPEKTDPEIDPEMPEVKLAFYGTSCSARFDEAHRVSMRNCSESSAADMWEDLAAGGYDILIKDCLKIREELDLCDWAYYQLTESFSKEIYGYTNEAVMLQAFIMSQSGFKFRLGRTDDKKLHILLGTSDGLYDYPYYVIGGEEYYLTDGSMDESMYVFDKAFPGEKSIRLTMNRHMGLDVKQSTPKFLKSEKYDNVAAEVAVNGNLIAFYNDYPHPFKKGDPYSSWVFYAVAPLSAEVESELYSALIPRISGLTKAEAADVLLNFVQTAFDYKTDGDFWGYERSFFPEETLHYPYCDCEDRAILYSRLVRDLLGLKVVFLYYPNHLATAVAFDEEVRGDYILIDGERYVVCDPTYINASIGMTMPSMDNSTVKVVVI